MIKNRTIFTRDNLEVLRGMKDESMDLIYLDPPFNSNHDYSAPIGSQSEGAEFKDIWGLEDIDLAWHGEIENEHPGLYELLSAARKIHSDSMMAYLIYMSIRIMEMKRVLKMGGGSTCIATQRRAITLNLCWMRFSAERTFAMR